MKAIIAGGGIAGLAAALSLREHGWETHVYEKSAVMDAGIGNGLAMGANALRLLEHWGIDLAELEAGIFLQERVIREDTGELIRWFDHSYNKEATGYTWLAMKRVRLYQALLRAVSQTPGGLLPIAINTASKVAKLDCRAGKVWLQNGEEVKGDVVIVAEGVWTKLIYDIDPTARPLKETTTAFRMEFDIAGIQKDDVLRKIWENEEPGFVKFQTNDPRSMLFLTPQTDDALFGIFLHPFIEAKDDSAHKWNAEASMEDLLKFTESCSGIVKRLVPLARNLVRWTLNIREPVAHFVNGRAAVIGDAAHPHIPTHGQGATSAMEDAASLGIFLSSPKLGSCSVEARLQKWNEFRYARASTVQTISINGGKPLESFIDKIRDTIGYQGPLPENVNLHERPVQEFFFRYDVRKEAEAFLDGEVASTKSASSQDVEAAHTRVDSVTASP